MGADRIDVPPQWEQLDLSELRGLLMVVGAPDVGKSTFARYLFQRLNASASRAAYLDGDPGQTSLGPPATMTAALGQPGQRAFPPGGRRWRSFAGSTSPSGHMLPVLVGAWRLAQAVAAAGAQSVVYDTSGLVDPRLGGLALKLAKIELLRPTALFALQREQELEPLLRPLRRSRRLRVVDLAPSPATKRRERSDRQQHRAARFADYFAGAGLLEVYWPQLAVFPGPDFSPDRLAALEDQEGFTLGLGIVMEDDRPQNRVTLFTPLKSLQGVDTLRVGSLSVDPQTYRDARVES